MDPAFAPAGGPAPLSQPGLQEFAVPQDRDGAHLSLSPAQAATIGVAGLAIAVALALAPTAGLVGVHHLFFAVFLLGGLTRLAAACTPLATRPPPPLAEEDLPAYTIIAPLYRE
ncbi:MAG: family 2 glycosyl transferase, partial [Caulobacter sp.]|nr:family 2 glycosyl transferase [Caulobacter sp.]